MQTIVCISTPKLWSAAQQVGLYRQSTINMTLREVGFIHCTTPDQTIEIAQRFTNEPEIIFLLIDTELVGAPVRFEAAKSGRAGLFPHIYGPLNCDAVVKTITAPRGKSGNILVPDEWPTD